jgi:putative transcriptional regulator
MNIEHHPSSDLILDYATGAMREAWSLAIATHLSLCPDCRRNVAGMEALGGQLLDTAAPAPLAAGALDAVMARLDWAPTKPDAPPPSRHQYVNRRVLPEPLRRYVGGDVGDLKWQRLGLGAYQFLIPTGESGATARLLRIPAGLAVPAHTHRGLELTLILSGAFSDTTGMYRRGDLQEADENLSHQPHAAPGQDCICLAVTDAPLKFSSLAARLVQPFLGI